MDIYSIITLMAFGFFVHIFYTLNVLKKQNHILKKKLEILEEKIGLNQISHAISQDKVTAKEKDFVPKKALHVKPKSKEEVKEKLVSKKEQPVYLISNKRVKEYLLGGNPLVKIGAIILFVGLSFLLKFAISSDMISVEMGLIFVGIAGLLLVGVGLRYRKKEGSFGVILQGVGFGVFYLDIFAASKFFTLLHPLVALLFMVIAVVGAVLLAIKQDSLPLAIFAIVGGFLAPILLASKSGSHIVLFSYYGILNVGILLISYKKSWRILNLIGFFFTFIVGYMWGYLRYESHLFSTTEPFVIFFFLLYVLIGFLFAKKVALKAYIDTILIFGVPVSFLIYQNFLSKDFEHLLTLSALGAGILYLTLAYIAKKDTKRPLLFEAYLVLGVIFLSFIVAFECSKSVASWIYAFEASGAIWISFRQNRVYGRYLALLLTLYGVQSYVLDVGFYGLFSDTKGSVFGFVILATALFLSSYLYRYYQGKTVKSETNFEEIYFYGALALWLGGGLVEIGLFELPNSLIFYVASLFVFTLASTQLKWENFEKTIEYMLPFMLLGMFYFIEDLGAPFKEGGLLVVLLVFLVFYFVLYMNKKIHTSLWHVIGFWSIVIVLNRQIFYFLERYDNPNITLFVLPILPLFAIFLVWRVSLFKKLFQTKTPLALQGLFLALGAWWVISLFGSGDFESFRYIPFLNPLDFVEILFLLFVYFWSKTLHVKVLHAKALHVSKDLLLQLVAIGVLVLLGVFVARFVHEYLHVNYEFKSLWQNYTFQTILSICYTLISLGMIVFAKKRANREIWIAGASLLGVVIVKLFFVELASSGTLQRVISFVAVGVLVLIVGFIAPLPPKNSKNASK